MTSLILRMVKRRSSLELSDPHEVCKIEFRNREGDPDLRVSAYEIDDQQPVIVRTHAEHSANIPLQPPGSKVSLHFGGAGVTIPTPESRFVFTRQAHREVCFIDERELVEAISSVWVDKESRQRQASTDQVRGHVQERLLSQDPEWANFCAVNEKWKKWSNSQ